MNSMSTEAYEQRIHKLEKQRAELLEVNKQWDQQFRKMKQRYENKRYHDALIAQLQETKEENQLLRKQNALFNRKTENYENEISRLNKRKQ
ncbi:TNFAIP3-interacting protein 3-like [Pelobates fuscus]|uniref:TNFAIP3-interacting protein 3-like n=1 Tax=Pelobates fuscus TaxID=191477 RepID=UPI002FE4E925